MKKNLIKAMAIALTVFSGSSAFFSDANLLTTHAYYYQIQGFENIENGDNEIKAGDYVITSDGLLFEVSENLNATLVGSANLSLTDAEVANGKNIPFKANFNGNSLIINFDSSYVELGIDSIGNGTPLKKFNVNSKKSMDISELSNFSMDSLNNILPVVSKISAFAFNDITLDSSDSQFFTIPGNITTIEEYAFSGALNSYDSLFVDFTENNENDLNISSNAFDTLPNSKNNVSEISIRTRNHIQNDAIIAKLENSLNKNIRVYEEDSPIIEVANYIEENGEYKIILTASENIKPTNKKYSPNGEVEGFSLFNDDTLDEIYIESQSVLANNSGYGTQIVLELDEPLESGTYEIQYKRKNSPKRRYVVDLSGNMLRPINSRLFFEVSER